MSIGGKGVLPGEFIILIRDGDFLREMTEQEAEEYERYKETAAFMGDSLSGEPQKYYRRMRRRW